MKLRWGASAKASGRVRRGCLKGAALSGRKDSAPATTGVAGALSYKLMAIVNEQGEFH